MSQFDLEEQIMNCWNICQDLEDVTRANFESSMTKDTLTNILIGMQQLYQIKFEKLFHTYESFLKENADKKRIQF